MKLTFNGIPKGARIDMRIVSSTGEVIMEGYMEITKDAEMTLVPPKLLTNFIFSDDAKEDIRRGGFTDNGPVKETVRLTPVTEEEINALVNPEHFTQDVWESSISAVIYMDVKGGSASMSGAEYGSVEAITYIREQLK